jgi:hypothetical protein
VNTAGPTVAGTPRVGEELTVSDAAVPPGRYTCVLQARGRQGATSVVRSHTLIFR